LVGNMYCFGGKISFSHQFYLLIIVNTM
jgi:hypothetical protein